MQELTFGEIEQVHGGMTLQQWLQEYITASEVQAPVIDIGSVD